MSNSGERDVAKSPIKAIRRKCLDCSGDSSEEVKKCTVHDCALYPFRTGKNPFRKPQTDEQKERARNRMQQLRQDGKL